jgi:hypothetical protein
MPLATAGLLGLMAMGQLGRELLAAVEHRAAGISLAPGRWPTVLVVLASLAGFGWVLEKAGFAIGAFLSLAVLFGVVVRKRWWVALGAAFLIAAIARLVFKALGVPLPEGPLGI